MLKLSGLLLAALPAIAVAQSDPRAMIERAVRHMGGEPALRALSSIRYDATAVLWALGQSPGLGEPLPLNTRNSTIRYDFAGQRQVVVSEFPGGPNNQPFRQRVVQSPQAGMVDNNGNLLPIPAIVPAGLRTFPTALLLAALDPATRLEPAGGGVRMYGALDTMTLYFDADGRLAYSETVADDPMLGDRVTRTTYRWWTLVGRDLWLPARVDVAANGVLTSVSNLRAFTTGESFADSLFRIPDSTMARSRTLGPGGTPPVTVRVDSLAPGIYHLTGGSHQSLAVVSGGAISVFEAPQSSARMNAVLDTLASRFPRTPVRLAINSHDHWDHASGVRAALSARVPVMAHESSLPQLRQTARARRTLAPDGVERMRPDFRAVRDSAIVGSGANMMIVYRLPTSHDDGLLVGYVPDARILFVTDVLPNQNVQPNREVAEFVAAHGLTVERVVPAHGAVFPWSRVQQLAQ